MSYISIKNKVHILERLGRFFDQISFTEENTERGIIEQELANLFLSKHSSKPVLLYSNGSLYFYIDSELYKSYNLDLTNNTQVYIFNGKRITIKELIKPHSFLSLQLNITKQLTLFLKEVLREDWTGSKQIVKQNYRGVEIEVFVLAPNEDNKKVVENEK